jgi:Cu-Zn family superoxide dismutase
MTNCLIGRLLNQALPLIFSGILILTGCSCSDPIKPKTDKDKDNKNNQVAQLDTSILRNKLSLPITEAEAIIVPLGDNKIRGKVTFTKVPEGVKIVADIEGLTEGEHGFHVHEYGECGSKDGGAAAGAHFNPTQSKHGGADSQERHVGDLGNLVADSEGHAHYERVDKLIQLQGKNSILGRSIIIHADKDDYVTQPAGASGARIGCGIIEPVINQ